MCVKKYTCVNKYIRCTHTQAIVLCLLMFVVYVNSDTLTNDDEIIKLTYDVIISNKPMRNTCIPISMNGLWKKFYC